MLGENVLMAPTFGEGSRRDVYLPGPATWTHLWSHKQYDVGANGMTLENFLTLIGQPAVFYRDTDAYQISSVLKALVKPVTIENINIKNNIPNVEL